MIISDLRLTLSLNMYFTPAVEKSYNVWLIKSKHGAEIHKKLSNRILPNQPYFMQTSCLTQSWVYLNGKGAFGSISLQVDLHWSCFTARCDKFVAQFFQSITAVGDQLPDKHLEACGTSSKSVREEQLEITNWNVILAKFFFSSLSNTIPLTSFSEYKDLATMSSSFFVSAWNSCLEKSPARIRD